MFSIFIPAWSSDSLSRRQVNLLQVLEPELENLPLILEFLIPLPELLSHNSILFGLLGKPSFELLVPSGDGVLLDVELYL